MTDTKLYENYGSMPLCEVIRKGYPWLSEAESKRLACDGIRAMVRYCHAEAERTRPRRSITSGGACVTCRQHKEGELMPPHDASDRCESGKHNHCSCDVCF